MLLLLSVTGWTTVAQPVFDASFENGRLDTVYADSGAYVLWPAINLHARLTGAEGEQPLFKIYDSLGYQLRPYHHMVYRYEGDTAWHFFDTAYKASPFSYYHFTNEQPFSGDTVYLAYWFPYTYSDLQAYLDTIDGSPHLVNLNVKTTSPQGRNIYGYEITDTTVADCYKQHVVITARQHPIEHINGYFIEGLTNYLLTATDSLAEVLRSRFRFFIYPMLNPDGVFNGSGQNIFGQDINRSWEDSLVVSHTPESDSIRPVIMEETGGKVDWSVDIHANPGNNLKYYWWGYTDASPVPAWQIQQAAAYVQSVSQSDNSAPNGQTLFQNFIQGNGVTTGKTAANWFRKTFGAIAFTFEPTTEPMGFSGDNRITIANMRSAGASLAKGFAAVADTTSLLSGEILQTDTSLAAWPTGGLPPYTFMWEGPSGVDSSALLLHPAPGFYSLLISDANGCEWSQGVDFTPPTTVNDKADSKADLKIYPNPGRRFFTVEWEQAPPPAVVEAFDRYGRIVLTKTITGGRRAELDLSGQPAGIYLVRLRKNGIETTGWLLHFP